MKGVGREERRKKGVFSRCIIDEGEIEVMKGRFYVVGRLRFFSQVGTESGGVWPLNGANAAAEDDGIVRTLGRFRRCC